MINLDSTSATFAPPSTYSKGENWAVYTKQDGLLITGQNPASSEAVAKLLLIELKMMN
jgi:putative intracellular protease/amidase